MIAHSKTIPGCGEGPALRHFNVIRKEHEKPQGWNASLALPEVRGQLVMKPGFWKLTHYPGIWESLLTSYPPVRLKCLIERRREEMVALVGGTKVAAGTAGQSSLGSLCYAS